MADTAPPAKRTKITDDAASTSAAASSSPFVCKAEDAIHFHLVLSTSQKALENEIKEGGVEFDAEFFHQHFGEDEEIKGYTELNIDVWFSARTYHCWIDIIYKSKRPGADDLRQVLTDHFPRGYSETKQDFIKAVSTAGMPDISKLGDTVATLQPSGQAPILINRHNLASADPAIQDLHARFEPLLLFFIDGASLIDAQDNKWELLLAVQAAPDGGNIVMGMMTCYNFWAYPDGGRLRVSQVLILPPYQGYSLGKTMMRIAYDMAQEKKCIDLTIEDPTPNLQRIREKLEVEMMSSVPWIQQQAAKCVEAALKGETSWPLTDATASNGHSSSAATTNGGAAHAATTAAAAAATAAAATSTASRDISALKPPVAFTSKVTQELKINKSEMKLAWEALLYVQPGFMDQARGRSLMEQLVRSRLEAAYFAHNAADAEMKKVTNLNEKGTDFIMMRTKLEAADMGTADGQASAVAVAAAAAATGRLTVTTMSLEEKEAKMTELLEERMGQLATLKSLLARSSSKRRCA